MAVEIKAVGLEDAKSSMYELIDRHIKDIAFNRRVAEVIMGEPTENYDARLNEMCDKWNKKFVDMSRADIMRYMVEDLLETIGRSE